MIVKCEQCQTRFKIPDERVTDKGVKVRCTKCQHTFRVTRESAQPASAASTTAVAPPPPPAAAPLTSAPPRAPLAYPGAGMGVISPAMGAPAVVPGVATRGEFDPFAQFGDASDASSSDQTREGYFNLGIEASKVLERTGAPLPPDPMKFVPPSAPRAFDFSSLVPNAPERTAEAAPIAARVPVPVPVAVPRASPAQATRSVPAVARPVPTQSAPSPFDFAGLQAPPPSGPGAAKVAPASSSPFDFAALGSARVDSEAGPSAAPFDFGSLGPSVPATSTPAAPDAPAFDFNALEPAAPSAPRSGAAFEDAAPATSSLFADVPDLNEPAGSSSTTQSPNVPDDFFGSAMPASSPPSGAVPSAPGQYRMKGAREELFDLPPPRAAADEPGADAPLELITLGAPTTQTKVRSSPSGLSPAGNPNVPLGAAEVSANNRGALGVVVNLGIAVALVALVVIVGSALLNDGKLDVSTFSLTNLKALVSRDAEFEPNDISNGLYDTQRGKPVFYVRGEILNRGNLPTRVRVRAEILDGDTIVRAAEVLAGSPPTPEQLRSITGAEEVERLLSVVSKSAPTVAPGESAAFLVTFFEYPPDLKAFRVRVSARADGQESAER